MTEHIYIWSDSYSVGHPMLDLQHQRMLSLCRQVEEASSLSGPEALSIIHILLTELSQHAQEHFKTEYRILHNIGYPHLQDEIAEHVHFQNNLTNILCQIKSGKSDDVALRTFLSTWAVEHLFERDMKYKPFLANQAASAVAQTSTFKPVPTCRAEAVQPSAIAEAILP